MLYDDANRGIIQHRERARQIIDFHGLKYGSITPTDVDGLFEYHNKAYIFIEVKYGKQQMPGGQKLAFERLTDDVGTAGKKAVLFVCEHNVTDCEEDIVAADTIVRNIYVFNKNTQKGEWKPGNGRTLANAVDIFLRWVDGE